jgi:hypothetical protein
MAFLGSGNGLVNRYRHSGMISLHFARAVRCRHDDCWSGHCYPRKNNKKAALDQAHQNDNAGLMLGIENRQVKRLAASGIFLKAIAHPVNMCYLFRVISYGFAPITCPFPGRF